MTLYGGVENSDFDPIIGITSDPGVSFFDITAVSEGYAWEIRDVANRVNFSLLQPAFVSIDAVYGSVLMFSTAYISEIEARNKSSRSRPAVGHMPWDEVHRSTARRPG